MDPPCVFQSASQAGETLLQFGLRWICCRLPKPCFQCYCYQPVEAQDFRAGQFMHHVRFLDHGSVFFTPPPSKAASAAASSAWVFPNPAWHLPEALWPSLSGAVFCAPLYVPNPAVPLLGGDLAGGTCSVPPAVSPDLCELDCPPIAPLSSFLNRSSGLSPVPLVKSRLCFAFNFLVGRFGGMCLLFCSFVNLLATRQDGAVTLAPTSDDEGVDAPRCKPYKRFFRACPFPPVGLAL